MSLGNEKGQIIESAIADSIVTRGPEQIVFLEFGSHIGDGTLRIIRQLTKAQGVKRCLVFSLEANQEWLGIGTTLVRHVLDLSKETGCEYIPLALKKDVSKVLDMIKSEFHVTRIDGVFLDHNHAQFTSDINIMTEKDLLIEGTLIIADNALRHRQAMRGFIEMMKENSRTFTLVDVKDPYPDQLLISEWQRKPSHSEEL
jgi:predicted O-methyltransferase YrrM